MNIDRYREFKEQGWHADREIVFEGGKGTVKKAWIVDENEKRVSFTTVYIPFTKDREGKECETLKEAKAILLDMIKEHCRGTEKQM